MMLEWPFRHVSSRDIVAPFTDLFDSVRRGRENSVVLSERRMVEEFSKRREHFSRDLNEVLGFRCTPPDGAFYAWVNISETGTSAEEVCRVMLEEAGVAAIPGAAFGLGGRNYVRFSFASSTAILHEAVERILRVSSTWHRAIATPATWTTTKPSACKSWWASPLGRRRPGRGRNQSPPSCRTRASRCRSTW